MEELNQLSPPVDDLSIPVKQRVEPAEANRTAVYAALAEDKPLIETFERYKEAANSESADIDIADLKGKIAKDNADSYMDYMKREAVKSGGTTQEILDGYINLTQEDPSVKLTALEKTAQRSALRTPSKDNEERAFSVLKTIGERTRLIDTLNTLASTEESKNPTAAWDITKDFADLLLPLQTPATLGSVTKEILDERYYVMAGDAYQALATHIKNTPVEQQEKEIERVVESIVRNSGVISDLSTGQQNDMAKTFALESLKHYLQPGGPDSDATRIIDNILGSVELFGVLPAKSLGKIVGKYFNGVESVAERATPHGALGNITAADPELGSILHAESIKNADVATSMGTTPEGAAMNAMPQPIDGAPFAGVPPKVKEAMEGIQVSKEAIMQIPENTFIYTDKDFEARINTMTTALNGAEGVFVWHPDKFRMGRKGETGFIEYQAVLGKDNTQGFFSRVEAQKAMQLFLKGNNRNFKSSDFTVMVRNTVTDELEEFANGAHFAKSVDVSAIKREIKIAKKDIVKLRAEAKLEKGAKKEQLLTEAAQLSKMSERFAEKIKAGAGGEFFLQVKGEKALPYNDLMPLDPAHIDPSGGFLGFFRSPESKYAMDIHGGFIVGNEKKFVFKHDLFSLTKPYQTLPFASKQKVTNLISEGDQLGIAYNPEQLRNLGFSEDETIGYLSNRAFWDVVYDLKNREVRDTLIAAGNKGLRIDRGDGVVIENAGIPIDRDAATKLVDDIKEVYDPLTGTATTLSEKEIAHRYTRGESLVKVLSKFDDGKGVFNYAFVKANAITELPLHVLQRRDGYVHKLNVEPFYIDELTTARVDGKDVSNHKRTFGTASSRVEAKAMVERAKASYIEDELQGLSNAEKIDLLPSLAAEANKRFSFREDRNISSSGQQLAQHNKLLNSNVGYWFNKRGEHLKRMDGSKGRIADPIQSIERVSNAISTSVTHNKLLDVNSARLRKTWPQFFDNEGRYIGHELAKAGKAVENPDLLRANSFHNYIEGFRGIETNIDRIWKNTMLNIDASIAKAGVQFMSEASAEVFLKGLANTSPGRMLTGSMFTMSLALNPGRQLFLQGQSMYHMVGVSPLALSKAARDATLLSATMMGHENKAAMAMILPVAKSFGYSEKEWMEVFNQFRKTGKAYAIDSNVYINELNFGLSRSAAKTRGGYIADNVLTAMKSPVAVMKAAGFDAGEIFNQMVSWSFARHLHTQNNPKIRWNSSQGVLDRIAADSKVYGFDMTKSGRMDYQRGAFAAMTQFWSIQNKALLNIMPTAAGGTKALNGVRGRYALGLYTMYGAAGVYGLDALVDSALEDSGINLSEPLYQALKGGLFQTMLNTSLDLVGGSDVGTTKLAWSKDMSPLARVGFMHDFASAFITGDSSAMEILAGASSSLGPNIAAAATSIRHMWAQNPDDDSVELVLKSIQEMGRYFGQFSKVAQYNMSKGLENRIGKLQTVTKQGKPISDATATELLAKALVGVPTQAETRHWEKVEQSVADRKQIKKDAKDVARTFYKIWYEHPNELEAAQIQGNLIRNLFAGNPAYGMQVAMMAKEEFRRHTDFEKFTAMFMKNHMLQNPDQTKEGLYINIDHDPSIPTEEKQKVKDFVKSLYDDIAGANDLLQRSQ